MGTNTLENIKSLIGYLPVKDKSIAEKYIQKRDFDSLQMLVDSAIKRIENSLSSNHPKEEYLHLDTDMLNSLLVEVSIYNSYLDISEFDNNEDDKFYEDVVNMCEEW